MNKAVIIFGSNTNPKTNIERSLNLLKTFFKIINCTDLTSTKPEQCTSNDYFLNGGFEIQTSQSKKEVIGTLKKIEKSLNRDYNQQNHITIDLDLISWNEKKLENYSKYKYIKKIIEQLR